MKSKLVGKRNLEAGKIPIDLFLLCNGILTVVDYNEKREMIYVGYPNEEMKETLEEEIPELMGEDKKGHTRLHTSLMENNMGKFVHLLSQYIFKDISGTVDVDLTEFMATLLVIPVLRAAEVKFEESKLLWGKDGRKKGDLHICLQTDTSAHIIEMKCNETAVTGIIQWIGYIINSEQTFHDFLKTENIIDKGINF